MKPGLKSKIFLAFSPLAALLLVLFLVRLTSFATLGGEVRDAVRDARSALLMARLATLAERDAREYADALRDGPGKGTPLSPETRQAMRDLESLADSRGSAMLPEEKALVAEAAKGIWKVADREEDRSRAEKAGDGEYARDIVRKEILPRLDGLPLSALSDRARTSSERFTRNLSALSARAATVSLSGSSGDARPETPASDLGRTVTARRFARTFERQARGYGEAVERGGLTDPFDPREEGREARELVERLRATAGARSGTGDGAGAADETAALAEGIGLLEQSGERAMLLLRAGETQGARDILRREAAPLTAAVAARADRIAQDAEAKTLAGIGAIRGTLARARWAVVALGLAVVLAAGACPWMVIRFAVAPFLGVREAAYRTLSERGIEPPTGPAAGRGRDEAGDLQDLVAAVAEALGKASAARDYFDGIVRSIPSCVFVVSPDGLLRTVNAATCRMLGYEETELLGQPATVLFAMDEEVERAWIEELRAREHASNMEKICRSRDGFEIPVLCAASTIRDASGEVAGVVCVAQDITDRIASEKALQEAHDSLRVWVDELERRNREITHLNRLGDRLQTCLSVEEAYRVFPLAGPDLFPGTSGTFAVLHASRNMVEVVAHWGAKGMPAPYFSPEDCWGLRSGKPYLLEDESGEIPCRHLDGDLPARSICLPMVAQGETIGVLTVRYDAAEGPGSPGTGTLSEPVRNLAVTLAGTVAMAVNNLRLRASLKDQSIRDGLTGLFNRRYMEETLVREVMRAKRAKWRVGIILIDIDHFKSFNDTFGHAAGDAILREFGAYLKTRVRTSDIACRYGGEEFTLVLPDAPAEIIVNRAESIREGVFQSLTVEHQGRIIGPVTISAGVAFFPEHGETAEAVLQAADKALYRAKAEGRDRIMVAEGVPRPA